jgi:hypothetical protein
MDNVEPGGRVGRAQEAAELERMVGRVAGGQGQAVVVRGEPGIGKTRPVGTALAACERRGFEAYVAAASEMEMRRPFGVIADALQLRRAADYMRSEIRQMLRRPADEAAEGGQAGGEGVEFQLAERVVEYLEARAADAPVVRASPRRLYLALCLEDAALALARAGKAGDARPLAFEALHLLAGMDAVTALKVTRLGPGSALLGGTSHSRR